MADEETLGELADESFIYKEITWKIPNVLSIRRTAVKSPEFSFANGTWVLCLQPWGQTKYGCQSFVDIGAFRLQSLEEQQTVYCNIFIKTCRGREFEATRQFHTFTSLDKEAVGFGVPNFLEFSKLTAMCKSLLPGGTLTVVFQMRANSTSTPVESSSQEKVDKQFQTGETLEEVLKDSKNSIEVYTQTEGYFADRMARNALKDCTETSEVLTEIEEETGIGKLSRDLIEVLLSGENSDLTIKVKNSEFRLHRMIMGARTPVFSAMLRHDMTEKATGLVSINDCEPEVFRDFVRYVYSGRTDELTKDTVFGLFALADKYQVEELKTACFEFARRTLSADSFCDVVKLALAYDKKELLEQTTDYLAKRMVDILQTVNWMNFMREHYIQANELLLKAAQKNKEK